MWRNYWLILCFSYCAGTVTAVSAAGALGVVGGVWYLKKVRAKAPVTCGVQSNENRLFWRHSPFNQIPFFSFLNFLIAFYTFNMSVLMASVSLSILNY